MDELSISVIIAQIINFWILFFVFKYFLWDKIIDIIEERRKQITNIDSSEDLVKKKIEKADIEAKEIISKSRQDALNIQKNTEELVKRETKQKIDEAQLKADTLVDWALRNIEKERLSMVNSLKDKLVDISLQVNSKIFEDSSKNKEFIKKEENNIKI